MAASKTAAAPAAARAKATKTFAVVRIRGTVDLNGKIADTMKMLRLHKPNVCVLVPDDPSHKGMLAKIKDYVAYGEVDAATAAELVSKRGRFEGDVLATNESISKATGAKHATIDAFAKALASGEARVKDAEGLKPYFRLHPPRGGHDGPIKKHHTVGGVLGYQGKEINATIRRML